jgi:CHAT domain-containing protein/tetratricopeptide (TPR) repeat protein
MAETNDEEQHDELIDQLAQVRNSRARASFLRRHPQLWNPPVVERLYTRVVRLARTDLQRADRLAQAAKWVADKLEDDGCRAQSLRAAGHVRFCRGRYTEALEHYDQALMLFRRLTREVDVARTLNGALQSLISLGRYEEALASVDQARAIFERHGNLLGLARLDSNAGNIMVRQDRFDEALTLYARAHERLAIQGEPPDVAAVLSNLAMVYRNLNDFQRALETHHQAHEYCERHDMPLLVARADYNIAYLYYLRGDYTRALELYRAAQEQLDRLGDIYLSALCDLDQSEIYLELNLSDEAGELAERALVRFDGLGMAYEEAKALTNLALAASGRRDVPRRQKLFARARELFAGEGNQVWLARLDLYEALVLYRDEQYGPARRLCEHALKLFARAAVPGKAAMCELLLARLELQAGDLEAAERACRGAFGRLAGVEAPTFTTQANFVLGLIHEARGERAAAYTAFREAHRSLEHLRSRLQAEDLKVAFLEDKLAVYESLVTTCLALGTAREHREEAFGYIEQAKSRSLADLIAFRAATLEPRVAGEAPEEVRHLRQELNWHYRQLELEETAREKRSARRMDSLRDRAEALEKQLVRSLDELRRTDEEFSALQSGRASELEEIRSTLASDTLILEYYQARGQTYVCVLGRDLLDIVPLAPAADVRNMVRLLQFQLSKFRLGPKYVGLFADQLQAATHAHLHELYTALIAPIRDRLQAAHLIVVPHGVLHTLPFHALFDGSRFLIDDFTVSYAPSSSVYRLCWNKPAASGGGALVMGVPDAQAPFIADEVRAVANVLDDPHVFMGADATADQLRRYGATSRWIHIATHGLFRKDNPMFSSIRLGDGALSVYDLYQLRLSADLVTLSGCSTGLNAVAGGDELLGLVRGLLYSGARAVQLTLWDAYDMSTAEFMATFYGHLHKGRSKARAAQEAMRALRDRYPHPFYWAPFTLVGEVQTT